MDIFKFSLIFIIARTISFVLKIKWVSKVLFIRLFELELYDQVIQRGPSGFDDAVQSVFEENRDSYIELKNKLETSGPVREKSTKSRILCILNNYF